MTDADDHVDDPVDDHVDHPVDTETEQPPARETATPPTDEGVDAVDGDPRSAPVQLPWLVALVAVAAAAASIVWGVSQRSDADDVRAAADRQREAVLVTTGFVEALMSYDFEALDAQQVAVEQFATENFRTEYRDAFTTEVRDQIVAEQAVSNVTVREVFVTVDDGDELVAIAVTESEVVSGKGATALLESLLRVRLIRLDGRWQVDDLTSLGSRDRSAPIPGQPDGAGSTDVAPQEPIVGG